MVNLDKKDWLFLPRDDFDSTFSLMFCISKDQQRINSSKRGQVRPAQGLILGIWEK